MLLLTVLLVTAVSAKFEILKCCPYGYSIDENYGYTKPEAFKAGNLHCRKEHADYDLYDSENISWIPEPFNSYEEVDVPDTISPILSSCAAYDLKVYRLTTEGILNITESGHLQFTTGGVEDTELIELDGGTYCLDKHFYDVETVLMTCACPQGHCVQYCCGDYANIGYIDSSHNLDCKYVNEMSEVWDLNTTRADIAPGLKWVERSTQSLRRQCTYASAMYQTIEEMKERPIYVLKYREVNQANKFHIDSHAFLHADGHVIDSKFYCVAPTLDEDSGKLITSAFFCETATFLASHKDVVIQSWFAGAGAIFSLLTVLGIVLSPELRRGPEGFTLLAHCLCMLAAYTGMAVRPTSWTVDGKPCLQLAHVLQFLLLSAFFWLNVRAVIIFTRFRSLETMLTRLSGKDKRPWLLPLCIVYAVGVPALVCILTAWAQCYSHREPRIIWADGLILPENHTTMAPSWLITPDLDDTTCWFGNALGRTIYYTLPMGIVLVVNLWMFISTVTSLNKLTRGGTVRSKDDLRSDKRRLTLFIKMFIVMGLAWSGEFLSFANYLSHYYWYFSTAATTIRAIAIFVIFCCRRVIWDELISTCCKAKTKDIAKEEAEVTTTKGISSNLGDFGKSTTRLN